MGQTNWDTSGRWALPAPETLVLLEGDKVKQSEPFKLALVELLARGVYAVAKEEKRRGIFGGKPKSFVVAGPKHFRPSEASLGAVYDLVDGMPQKAAPNGARGIEITDLAKGAAKRFGSLSGYTSGVVWPELIRRGLAEERQGRALFVIPTKKRVLTPAGESAREQARVFRQTAELSLGKMISDEPSGAVAFATSAGSVMLLSTVLYPELSRLRAAAAGDSGDAGSMVWDGGTIADDDTSSQSLEGLDFGALEFDALDGLADFSADVDAGFDSAGGDSGGDGGGDGGGGGD